MTKLLWLSHKTAQQKNSKLITDNYKGLLSGDETAKTDEKLTKNINMTVIQTLDRQRTQTTGYDHDTISAALSYTREWTRLDFEFGSTAEVTKIGIPGSLETVKQRNMNIQWKHTQQRWMKFLSLSHTNGNIQIGEDYNN